MTCAIATSAELWTEPISFTLPESLEAHEPPEARGLSRDDVRLLVSSAADDAMTHTRFTHLAQFLRAGDVLVVNTSATINAALHAALPNGERVEVHLSQRLPDGEWVVEIRQPAGRGTAPLLTAHAGEQLAIAGGGAITLVAPYAPRGNVQAFRHRDDSSGDSEPWAHPAAWDSSCHAAEPSALERHTRLWLAHIAVQGDLLPYLGRHGFPIRYGYVPRQWPLSYYQTMFAREPGSAEMPSAARAFTARVVQAVRARGVSIVPILLHTGVASLEAHEPPYPEYFRVSARAARGVNEARVRGGRVIAIGTTAVRTLESVAHADGTVSPGEGWTDIVITPRRGVRAVDALLTGFHEPRASHLAMLEAIAGRRHVELAYAAALRERYLWHEFGDLHLILPAQDGRPRPQQPVPDDGQLTM
ncbi:MAG TPA: S-adenosylmethionine:tRNA ribosyltransferase-isomerase [Gemmatimonadaceae bacterium]|nr:S-adenosylmethionine:tRNA ribosyltransferase-isomerase [Gemmatimonadaceae bacterium]